MRGIGVNEALAGRTIMITRPKHQAAQLASELEGFGARVLSCPTIEIADAETYEPLDDAINHLYGYDWIIFTSANGVEYFLRRLIEAGHRTEEMDSLRV